MRRVQRRQSVSYFGQCAKYCALIVPPALDASDARSSIDFFRVLTSAVHAGYRVSLVAAKIAPTRNPAPAAPGPTRTGLIGDDGNQHARRRDRRRRSQSVIVAGVTPAALAIFRALLSAAVSVIRSAVFRGSSFVASLFNPFATPLNQHDEHDHEQNSRYDADD